MNAKQILVMITAGGVLFGGCHQHADQPTDPGVEEIMQVSSLALMYRRENGRLPESLAEITEFNGETAQQDMWGNEIIYKVDGNGFSVRSAGPDKIFGNDDDPRAELKDSQDSSTASERS
ncbi:MAG: hypothetical protein KDB00_02610 [Planctomycetales bacterium]|nr:hypothetical protein [Planctomycetales bacterium]